MNSNQFLLSNNLKIDLAFSAFIPTKLEDYVDEEAKHLLMNFESWSIILKSWIKYIRSSNNVLCPEIVRTNNLISMGLKFTDDAVIKKLNQDWRNKNVETDVLSFSAIDEFISPPPNQFLEMGDIIVSVETALRQAKLHKHSLAYELKWLVSHGFLHLLGWDHKTSSTLDKMLTFQEKLIQTTESLFTRTCVNSDL